MKEELESKLAKLTVEKDRLSNNIRPIQRRLTDIEKERVAIAKQLQSCENPVRVSDHAILRYLERKYKFDIEAARKEILTEDRIAMIEAGCCKIHEGNLEFRIVERCIVTIVDTKNEAKL